MPQYRALRLAITGKISSGKSTVSAILRDTGITVLDADSIAREVMEGDLAVRKAIEQIIGTGAYTEQGLNTELVANTIFTTPKLKTELETVVHSAVWIRLEEAFAAAKPGSIVGVESAILYQTGYDAMFDILILVDASDDKVRENAAQTGRLSVEEVNRRLTVQNFGEEWKEDADYVLANDCPLDEFKQRATMLAALIRITAAADLPRLPLRIGTVNQGGKKH